MNSFGPLVVLTLITLLVVQQVLATVVYYDAKKRGIVFPHRYSIGIFAPLLGIVVIPWYYSERDTLAERFPAESRSSSENRNKTKNRIFLIMIVLIWFAIVHYVRFYR